MAYLLVLTGATPKQRFLLEKEKTVLGRDTSCDVVINETMVRQSIAAARTDAVSRRHAVILRLDGQYFLEDGDDRKDSAGRRRGSRNGTFVNGHKVPYPGRVLLHHHDRIRLCNFECAFHETQDGENDSSIEQVLNHDSSGESLKSQSAERLRIILEISNSLSKTLDLDELLPKIVDQLFEIFKQADRGFILLRDEASGGLVPHVFKTRHADDELDDRFSDSIVQQCLKNVQAILGNDLIRQFPESRSLHGLPIRSLMCAPFWSYDGQSLGAIQLDTTNAEKKFTAEDLNLLLGVASQASIALCNARLYRDSLLHQRRERDLELAHHVQRALLPQSLPDLPGYAFHAHYESALEVGGDYYDFIPLSGNRLCVLLGDVTGKGMAAALVVAKFRVEARVCLQTEPDPAVAFSRLNTIMMETGLSDSFVTLVAVVLDPATHEVVLVNAGHPAPLVCRRAGGTVEDATPPGFGGPPLGLFDGSPFDWCRIALQPGDGLVLYSDGITEAMNAQERPFGTARVRSVVAERSFDARQTGERLVDGVKQHAAGCIQHDDMTLVCLCRAGD
jgi:serine phosphatase RsbU (regulator of sigma subunit)/pSer/pThr/pTyr-binding forkhead associated (FHA) protein